MNLGGGAEMGKTLEILMSAILYCHKSLQFGGSEIDVRKFIGGKIAKIMS